MSVQGSAAARVKQQEATAANVISPKGISTKSFSNDKDSSSSNTTEQQQPSRARRRLTVINDTNLIQGLSNINTNEDENNTNTDIQESVKSDLVIECYAGVSKKGFAPYNPRKKNQDVLIMTEDSNTKSLLLCVFDGHGEVGEGVSQYYRSNFAKYLFEHPSFCETEGDSTKIIKSIQKAISESIKTLEKKIIRDRSIDTEFSGTTAVVTVIRGSTVVTGNIGDSRIIRGYTGKDDKIIAESISEDHKPDSPGEKERIIGAGGRVFAVEYDDGIDGPQRVWLGNMDVPGLAMSRSLGDTVAHSAGVSSDPEFFITQLTPNDKYLVLATDGLWEFMTNQEVIDIVSKQDAPRKAVDLLITEANNRWMKEEQVIDDTTVIVALVK